MGPMETTGKQAAIAMGGGTDQNLCTRKCPPRCFLRVPVEAISMKRAALLHSCHFDRRFEELSSLGAALIGLIPVWSHPRAGIGGSPGLVP